MLPQPVKDGDYEKAAASFMGDKWWKDFKVEQVMEPAKGASLAERIEVMQSLRKHSAYDEEIQDDYARLKEKAGSGEEFVKTGRLYHEALTAAGKNWRDCEYDMAFDFINERLKDHPDEFAVFTDLVKSGLSIASARKIFDCLPQPVRDGDYEKAAKHFQGDKSWKPHRIEKVMTPVFDVTLKDRIDIFTALEKHAGNGDDRRSGWECATADLASLQKISNNGAELVKIGRLYTEMLDNYGATEWSKAFETGLDFINRRLQSHPDEFRVFCDLLKSGVSLFASVKIFDMLPQPVKDGDYEKAAASFMGDKWWKDFKVEAVMKPMEASNLQERMALMKGLAKHCYDYDVVEEYNSVAETAKGTREFLHIGGMYLRTLGATGGYADDTSRKGLRFAAEKLREDPEKFESFLRLVASNKSIAFGMEAYDAIQAPVGGEKYEAREQAALSLGPRDFKEKYAVASRHICPGETVGDSAALLAQVVSMGGYDTTLDDCEKLLVGLQEKKGKVHSDLITGLLKTGAYSVENPEPLLKTVDHLSRPVRNETFEERQQVVLKIFNTTFRANSRYMGEAVGFYDFIVDTMDENESLAPAYDRFNTLAEGLHKALDPGNRRAVTFQEYKDTFVFLSGEKKKGSFGDLDMDEATSLFIEEVIRQASIGGTLKDAKGSFLHRFAPTQERKIESAEDHVKIAGVKLRKK
jgi:hypothetical protein